jgi:hypothetical protein
MSTPTPTPTTALPLIDPRATTTTYADLPVAPAVYHEDQPRRRYRTPMPWLPWAVVASIVALLLLGWLASALVAGTTAPRPTAAAADRAALTAGGADVLGDPASVRDHVGQQAVGSAVRVQSVVSTTGVWVGSTTGGQVFVHVGAAHRLTAGDRVDLTGTVRRLGTETFGLNAVQGLDLLRTAGAYIQASALRLSS